MAHNSLPRADAASRRDAHLRAQGSAGNEQRCGSHQAMSAGARADLQARRAAREVVETFVLRGRLHSREAPVVLSAM